MQRFIPCRICAFQGVRYICAINLSTIIRVGIIDDDPRLLDSMERFINAQEDISCMLKASSIGQFFEGLNDPSRLDVVLVDVELGEQVDSLQHLEKLLSILDLRTKCIIITGHNLPDYVRRAFQKGASGFCLKGSDPEAMIEAIRSVHRGGVFMSPDAAVHLLPLLRKGETAEPLLPDEVGNVPGLEHLDLKKRELQIAVRLIEGRSYQDIADEIFLSINTVRHYVKSIYRKFGVANKVQLSRIIRPLLKDRDTRLELRRHKD